MWTVPTRVATPDGSSSSSSSSANSFFKVWFFSGFRSFPLLYDCLGFGFVFPIDLWSEDSSADEDFWICVFFVLFYF